MNQKIFEVIETALANNGFQVLDGDRDCVIIRDKAADKDFQISVT